MFMKKVLKTLMVLSLIVFVAASGMILIRNREMQESADAFSLLFHELNVLSTAMAEGTGEGAETASSSLVIHGNPLVETLPLTEDAELLAYWEMAKALPDLVGWIKIEGTPIDYPVMHSPEEAERYLHRNFDGQYSRSGTPFMMPVSDPSVPNENIILYGHHMKDGSDA